MGETNHEYRKKYPIIRPSVVKEVAHGSIVSNLAYRIGKQMEFTEKECHELAVAGFLHDVGKLELAKYLRGHQEETLIIEEMKYVRLHSQLGADILEKKGYSQKIVEMNGIQIEYVPSNGSGNTFYFN